MVSFTNTISGDEIAAGRWRTRSTSKPTKSTRQRLMKASARTPTKDTMRKIADAASPHRVFAPGPRPGGGDDGKSLIPIHTSGATIATSSNSPTRNIGFLPHRKKQTASCPLRLPLVTAASAPPSEPTQVTSQAAAPKPHASVCTDTDGERFVADVGEFKPVDWKAKVRLGQ
jgi:hypothetical protein